MRNSTMVAVSAAAAAAAAALSGWPAQASTPDWLTLATVEDGHDSLLPGVCEAEESGALTGAACSTVLGSPSAGEYGMSGALPESPGGYGGAPAIANVDLRNFAKWQVCGVAVGASTQGADCDNSIAGPSGPMGPGSGVSLVNADTTGAFQWSVCGVSVGQANAMTDC